MGAENVPPELTRILNDLEHKVYELERRLGTGGGGSAILVPTDFTCFDITDVVGSVEVSIAAGADSCASGYRGTGWIPVFPTAD